MKTKQGSEFLYDSQEERIVGVKDPSGSERILNFNQINTKAVSRMIGISAAGDSTGNITRCGKIQVDAPFSRVRFRLHRETNAPATNFKMVAAVTETAAIDTPSNLSHPVDAGVAYPALRSSVGAPGWATVTVGGVATFDWPGTASADNPIELVTDWIDLASIARKDGDGYLIMLRLEHDSGANGAIGVANIQRWLEAEGQSWFKVNQWGAITSGNGVTDLTTTFAALGSISLFVSVEVDYDVPATTVLGIGDSNLENSNLLSMAGYGTWGLQACAKISSPRHPVTWVNAGNAGKTSTVYSANGVKEILQLKPGVVIYASGTSNERNLTRPVLNAEKANLKKILDAAQQVGAKVIAYGALPQLYSAAEDALRLEMHAYCKSLHNMGALRFISFEALLGTGAVPNRMKPNMNTGDLTHVSNLAEALMADITAPEVLTERKYQ